MQSNEAAERSAHVSRNGPAKTETISPVVEVRPGVYRLRVLVEAEQEADRRAIQACRRGYMAGLEMAAAMTERWGELELRDEILSMCTDVQVEKP